MWKFLLLLSVFAPVLVYSQDDSQCNCYEMKNLTSLSAVICNAYNPNNFLPCYQDPCAFEVYAGDASFVWSYLNIHWLTTTSAGGVIQIFDGTSDSGTPLVEIAEGEDVRDGSAKNIIKSKTSTIFVKYTQSGAAPNVYMGAIRAIPSS